MAKAYSFYIENYEFKIRIFFCYNNKNIKFKDLIFIFLFTKKLINIFIFERIKGRLPRDPAESDTCQNIFAYLVEPHGPHPLTPGLPGIESSY